MSANRGLWLASEVTALIVHPVGSKYPRLIRRQITRPVRLQGILPQCGVVRQPRSPTPAKNSRPDRSSPAHVLHTERFSYWKLPLKPCASPLAGARFPLACRRIRALGLLQPATLYILACSSAGSRIRSIARILPPPFAAAGFPCSADDVQRKDRRVYRSKRCASSLVGACGLA